MKKILFTLAAFVMITLSADAQVQREQKERKMSHDKAAGKKHHGMKKDHQKVAVEKLNLSETQKQQMKSLNMEFRDKMQELNKNENITVKESKEKRAALIADRKAKM